MDKDTYRVVTRGADGQIRIRDYDSQEALLKRHSQVGVDDCSTDLGLRGLPVRSAWAVAAARGVYREIGVQVVARGPSAWDSRTSVSGRMKALRALQGGLMSLRGATLDRWRKPPARPALWSKI